MYFIGVVYQSCPVKDCFHPFYTAKSFHVCDAYFLLACTKQSCHIQRRWRLCYASFHCTFTPLKLTSVSFMLCDHISLQGHLSNWLQSERERWWQEPFLPLQVKPENWHTHRGLVTCYCYTLTLWHGPECTCSLTAEKNQKNPEYLTQTYCYKGLFSFSRIKYVACLTAWQGSN